MNERFANVQYDFSNQTKYLPMISNQESGFPFSNKTSNTSNLQGTSLNNYGMDYSNNTSRMMDVFYANNSNNNNNKYVPNVQNLRIQTPMDRPNFVNRYNSLQNNVLNGTKYNPGLLNNDQRIFPTNMNSLHPMHMAISSTSNNSNNNNNNNNKNQILSSPSLMHKSIDSDLLMTKKDVQRSMTKNVPATMFYTPSNLKLVSQLQKDNELESPKWIVFPPVLQSAVQLRQGKQHLVRSKSVENVVTMDNELKKILIDRISACLISVNMKNGAKIPDTILQYTDITAVESTYEVRKSKSFNYPSICYKAFNTETDKFVLFRRFPGFVIPSVKEQTLERLRRIKHPGLIPINHVFVTEGFEDNSTVFIMDYHPCSVTALQTHASDVNKVIGFASPFNVSEQSRPYSSTKKASDLNMLTEDKSWCYLIQLINIVRYVHNVVGMCCKLIDPSKVLIQYPDRVRLNCFGIIDFLLSEDSGMMEDTNDLIIQQTRDLEHLGQFMICVICGTTIAIQDNDQNIAYELVHRFYSNNLKTIIMKLIHSEFHSINEVAASTFAECYNHVNNLYTQIDYLELNLMKELECGKLFRLVCKLATICERNELGMDSNWSDYGANYQLKLFRDFVFHQIDSNGAPYLDLAHIVTCLNKLDAGSNENVCLISRDGLNMFCVTFSDLKQVLDDSFEQLMSQKNESNL